MNTENEKDKDSKKVTDYDKMFGELVLRELKGKVERKIEQNDPLVLQAIKSMIKDDDDLPKYLKR